MALLINSSCSSGHCSSLNPLPIYLLCLATQHMFSHPLFPLFTPTQPHTLLDNLFTPNLSTPTAAHLARQPLHQLSPFWCMHVCSHAQAVSPAVLAKAKAKASAELRQWCDSLHKFVCTQSKRSCWEYSVETHGCGKTHAGSCFLSVIVF